MVWPLDENQGPSHLHGHSPWLVCGVALGQYHTYHTRYREMYCKVL